MRKVSPLSVLIAIAFPLTGFAVESTVKIGSFRQQLHNHHPVAGTSTPEATAIAVVPGKGVHIATPAGVLALQGDDTWHRANASLVKTERLAVSGDTLYAVTDAALHLLRNGEATTVLDPLPDKTTSLTVHQGQLVLGTTLGLYRVEGASASPDAGLNALLGEDKVVRDIASTVSEIAVAANAGLFVLVDGTWSMQFPQEGATRWAPVDVRAVTYDSKGRLWFACPQGVGVREKSGEWNLFTGADGLPYNDFTCMAAGPDGDVWFGTTHGAIHFDGATWEFREGRRWLLGNHVHDIAVAMNGDAWFATDGGVSQIELKTMTLAEKAAFYEDEIDHHHKRTPFGYVVNAGLTTPGDKTSSRVAATDNDGQYTGLYAGAEALAYAATRDLKFKKRATDAFEALAFLSEVTQGGSNPAPPGFVARAIVATDDWNPNEHNTPELDMRKQQGDKLWKIMRPRWPTSADGKWYWKCDTSSDELDGHYFAYALYYDHVAESDAEKERCREVVRRVTDHLIEHDYRLVDHDGQPTRWARFSPKDLNDDPAWWAERGLNSLSVLTYLSIAHHVTGDPKYRDAYMTLVRDHKYALNGMCAPKLQSGPGSFVQFDDKMAFMNYYHLIRYETDPELLMMYYTSIYYYWNIEKYEMNPFFNFVYAACCLGRVRTDQWGDLDLTPTWPWLEQGIDTLLRYPLDLIDWRTTNAHRIDILPLPDHVREPGANEGKGYRVNGTVIPADERQSLSWSEDVWTLDDGSDGRRLRDGCPFLLAYYMGLHHGFIKQ